MLAKDHIVRAGRRRARQLDEDGYVVRERVFDAGECAAIAAECEELVARLEARRAPHQARASAATCSRSSARRPPW